MTSLPASELKLTLGKKTEKACSLPERAASREALAAVIR